MLEIVMGEDDCLMSDTPKVLRGQDLLAYIDERLAEYAVKNKDYTPESRPFEEEFSQDDTRTPFQHDRDRIIHSRAFRRLRGKTQVFPAFWGDHYRSRLSHSLEVAQMARSIARVFRLNEDLAEAIALGHDLGHPPFGHAAERKLNAILRGEDNSDICRCDIGGFRHNVNSLKVVDFFERYHSQFPGLNLTHWTREGILKHTHRRDIKGKTVLDLTLDLDALHIETDEPTFLEGQVVARCDEIAQVTHDLEDAFRAQMLKLDDTKLKQIPVYEEALEKAEAEKPQDDHNRRSRLIRHLIGLLIEDLVEGTKEQLEINKPGPPPIFRRIVVFRKRGEEVKKLQDVLEQAMYAAYGVARSDIKGKEYVGKLFQAYYEEPARMPDYVFRKFEDALHYSKATKDKLDYQSMSLSRKSLNENIQKIKGDPVLNEVFLRTIADHIAGMTDHYALYEYRQLFLPLDHPASF